jgi:hypothetical protein
LYEALISDQFDPAVTRLTISSPWFRLVAPFETDGRTWERMRWTDLYSGRSYSVTTDWPGGGEGIAGVNSLETVAEAYPFHPEPKRAGLDGRPCTKQAEGLLRRRTVQGAGTVCIGKEAHRLEDRSLAASLDELVNIFADPRRGFLGNGGAASASDDCG